MMEDKEVIIEVELKRLKVLHLSMLTGCLVFLAISFYIAHSAGGLLKNNKELIQIFMFISIFLLGLLPLSYYLYKRKIDKIYPEQDLYEKIVVFRGAYFIKIAIIEAACFLSTAVFLLTNNQYVLYQVMITLIVMFISAPYKSQMVKEMKMKDDHEERLE
jgi:hypothetical protein